MSFLRGEMTACIPFCTTQHAAKYVPLAALACAVFGLQEKQAAKGLA